MITKETGELFKSHFIVSVPGNLSCISYRGFVATIRLNICITHVDSDPELMYDRAILPLCSDVDEHAFI